MPRSALLLLAVFAQACTSVAWQPLPAGLPAGWRHCRLFVGDAALVLARDADAAAEVHALAAEAERLGAFYDDLADEHGDRFVFVYGGDREYAGALVGSHAFYVLGSPQEAALAVAEHYGAGSLLPALAERWSR